MVSVESPWGGETQCPPVPQPARQGRRNDRRETERFESERTARARIILDPGLDFTKHGVAFGIDFHFLAVSLNPGRLSAGVAFDGPKLAARSAKLTNNDRRVFRSKRRTLLSQMLPFSPGQIGVVL